MLLQNLFTLLFVLFLSLPVVAAEKKVILTSLEWPPYSGNALPGQGASAEVVRAAFKAVGYELEIRIYPWNRAFDEALNNFDVAGYFPEYPSVERGRHFLFSESVGKSPLGLVERVDVPVHWRELEDLKKYTIGVVRGYVNTEKFDQLIRTGRIRVDESVSDVFNLRKVLAGRVDASVSDANVFSYLTSVDPLLNKGQAELQMNLQLFGVKDVFVCFRNGRRGEELLKIFNEGLGRVRVQEIQRAYIESLEVIRH